MLASTPNNMGEIEFEKIPEKCDTCHFWDRRKGWSDWDTVALNQEPSTRTSIRPIH